MVKAIDINEISEALNDKADLDWNNCEIPPLTETQISNCLLENPQLVNLELNDGSLLLKAGSQVIVPYGTNAPQLDIGDSLNGGIISDISWDGNKLFYYVQYNNDKIHKDTLQRQLYEYVNVNGSLTGMQYNSCFSTTDAPNDYTYMYWYDITNNICKTTKDKGLTWYEYQSLPFALLSSDGEMKSIDHLFNSIGYIDLTVWLGKGVKGLAPNGRNEDGSLKNDEFISTTVSYLSNIVNLQNLDILLGPLGYAEGYVSYDEINNSISDSSGEIIFAQIGKINRTTNGKISSFNLKPTFHTVDYYDFQQADEQNVKLSTTQTITGLKTFSNQIIRQAVNSSITDTTRTSGEASGLYFKDKNSNNVGVIELYYNTDGSKDFRLNCRNADNTDWASPFSINTPAYGTGGATKVLTITPATDANDNQITTTEWVNNKLSNADYVIETGSNSNGWYRLYKSGWIEQGGTFFIPANTIKSAQSKVGIIVLPKSFTEHSYNIICNPSAWAGNIILQAHNPYGITSSFDLYGRCFTGGNATDEIHCIWFAFGK